jgi:hypothetical protein
LNKTLLDNREEAKLPGDQAPLIDVSVIIINWNTRQMLLVCIASVYEVLRRECAGINCIKTSKEKLYYH